MMIGWFSLLLIGCLFVLLLAAGIQDARTREIGNGKNAAIALLAPLWWWSIGMPLWPAVGIQLVVAVVVFAVFCLAFSFGWMGGGDVKLIAALALWLPAYSLVWMLAVMSLAGGVLTMVMLADHKIARRTGAVEVPYGVAIVVAALLTLREPVLNPFQ
ncbi:MAG TPA: prepilin peptidase [Sphingomonas sp.]|jgi:prepilin peptidase CpaA|nr:prepilin peptidase [Sphingomonas sp.]